MPASTEFELKLLCDEPAAVTLSPPLAETIPTSVHELNSTYFDTADHRLRKAGLALRVRNSGDGRFIQTLKGEGDGMIERPEWEAVIKTAKPSLKVLSGTPAIKALGEKPKLKDLFEVAVERTTYRLTHGESDLEVALDRGRISSAGDVHPVGEIEIELKSGSPKDVFDLARMFASQTELRLGVESKGERGFSLLVNKSPEAAKPGLALLDDEMTAANAFVAIAHSCLRHMRLNEDILLDRRDAEVLHQTRVALRRLRSAMSVFGDIANDEQAPVLRAELKRLSEPLGVARNLDVFLTETLPRERVKRPDEVGLLNLETQLEVRRTEAYVRVDAMLRSPEWRRLLLDLVTWLHAGAWLDPADKKAAIRLNQPARSFAVTELEKRRRQLKKRGRKLARITDEARHDLRITAKKLRYGSEFFALLFSVKKEGKRHAAFVSALKDLQDHLGALNDISTGRELVSDLSGHSAVFAAGLTAGDIDATSGPLLLKASLSRKALLKMRPFWR